VQRSRNQRRKDSLHHEEHEGLVGAGLKPARPIKPILRELRDEKSETLCAFAPWRENSPNPTVAVSLAHGP
jgi:hypothetical protein